MTELLKIKRAYAKLFKQALKVQDLEKADLCTKAIIRIDEILMQVAEVKKQYNTFVIYVAVKDETKVIENNI